MPAFEFRSMSTGLPCCLITSERLGIVSLLLIDKLGSGHERKARDTLGKARIPTHHEFKVFPSEASVLTGERFGARAFSMLDGVH
jgi:hypothetical protein